MITNRILGTPFKIKLRYSKEVKSPNEISLHWKERVFSAPMRPTFVSQVEHKNIKVAVSCCGDAGKSGGLVKIRLKYRRGGLRLCLSVQVHHGLLRKAS